MKAGELQIGLSTYILQIQSGLLLMASKANEISDDCHRRSIHFDLAPQGVLWICSVDRQARLQALHIQHRPPPTCPFAYLPFPILHSLSLTGLCSPLLRAHCTGSLSWRCATHHTGLTRCCIMPTCPCRKSQGVRWMGHLGFGTLSFWSGTCKRQVAMSAGIKPNCIMIWSLPLAKR